MGSRLAVWLELVWDALREIRVHPLRSLLTLSGIVFGSASLVSMISLAGAMQEMAASDMMRMGLPKSFWIRDRAPQVDARRAADRWHSGLRLSDLEALAAVPGVASVHGFTSGGTMLVGGPADRINVPVQGIDAGYLELRNMNTRAGRTLRPLDIERTARVAVVGSEIVKDLFGTAAPVGQTITLNGTRFRVIGVVEPIKIEFIPANFDWIARRIYIPYTYQTRYARESGRVDAVLVTAQTSQGVGPLLAAGPGLIERRHGVKDYEIENEAADLLENLTMADNILGGWSVVMFAIGGITLLVGGIGLFSVLLISVRERVREIGVRKALGADDRDILHLFLAESLTLAAMGAVLGVGAGTGLILITELIAANFGKTFSIAINIPAVFAATAFSLLAGLVFGWYPARRASQLDPIEAIAAE